MLEFHCNACPPTFLLHLLLLGAPAGGAASPGVYWMMANTQLGRRALGQGCRKPGDMGRLVGRGWQQAQDA